MKRVRGWMCVILIFCVLGVCGCMNNKDYSGEILQELEKKYNKTFEIEQMTLEFSGDSGKYYRAVCKEPNSGKSFVVKYYYDDKELYDEYCTMLLNEKFIDYLVSSDLEIAHAVAEIITVKHVLTVDDVNKGVEYCITNEDFDVKVSAYIFLDQSLAINSEIENKIVNMFVEKGIYRCSLDVVYMSSDSLSSAKAEYSDVYLIDDSLEKDVRVNIYRRYLISKESGAQLTEVVKGE